VLPKFSAAYLGWIALGALLSGRSHGALLMAMKERNFAVAVTLSKTEVLQVACLPPCSCMSCRPGWRCWPWCLPRWAC
jgi:uncharacterized membrane protein